MFINFDLKIGHRKTNQHDVWSLDIRELRPDQLGLYSCVGENKIGTASDLVELSRKLIYASFVMILFS